MKIKAKQISFGATGTVKTANSTERPIITNGNYRDEEQLETLCYAHKLDPNAVRPVRDLIASLLTTAGPDMPHAKYSKQHIELDGYIEGIAPDGHGSFTIGTGTHLTGTLRRFF